MNKGKYTWTLLSSLSRADFTRFQCNIFFKPVTIVNIALFVLNFLNLLQGDILTKAEKHFETLKDTCLPLPIWYQDGLTNQWKSRKLILQGKGYACISPHGSNELTWLPLRKIWPKGSNLVWTPAFKLEMKQQTHRKEESPVLAMAALKIYKKTPHWTSLTLWPPYLETDTNPY